MQVYYYSLIRTASQPQNLLMVPGYSLCFRESLTIKGLLFSLSNYAVMQLLIYMVSPDDDRMFLLCKTPSCIL